MSANISLGTVAAEVKIGLSQVTTARNVLKAELGQIGAALDKMATEAEKDGKRTDEALKRALDKDKLSKFRQELKATADAQKQLWGEMGRGATLAGGAITGALVGSTIAAGKFDGAMRNVNSIAKQSEAQFKQTSKSVLGLVDDKRIVDGPTKLAEGLYDVVSSGKAGAEAIEILKEAATGATAGLTSTTISTRALMAVLNSGVGGVNGAREAMDVLFKIVDRGVGNFEQLAGSIGSVLPMASKAGVSLQEIGAYLAVATKSGQSFAEATNDISNFLQKIIKPGKDTQKIFEEHGIAFGMAALQGKGLSGVLAEIIEKTKGDQQALADLFPDMQAFRGVLTAAAKEGRDFRSELGQMATATDGVGAKQAALNEQMKGATYQTAKAKQELERMAIEIGQHLLPIARDILKEIHGFTKAFHDLDPATQSAIVKFGLFGGALLSVFGHTVNLIAKLGELKALMLASGGVGVPGGGVGAPGGPLQGPTKGPLPWLAWGARGLGAAMISTAPITVPAMIAGGVAYGMAQDSIARSENEQQNLSLENRERITFLQNSIAQKKQDLSRLDPRLTSGHPVKARLLDEVDQMQREMETLQFTGISAFIRNRRKEEQKKTPDKPKPPTKPKVDQEAIDKAKADAQRAREGEADLKVQKLKDDFDREMEGWNGLDPAKGARLRGLADLIARAEQDKAETVASGDAADSPKSAASAKARAIYEAGSSKQERLGKLKDKSLKANEELASDRSGADRIGLSSNLEAERHTYQGLMSSYQGFNPVHRAQIELASVRVRLAEERLANFDLGPGAKSETDKAKARNEKLRARREEADRESELAQKDYEAQKRAGEAAMEGFEKWGSAQEKKRAIGERWADKWEKEQARAARAEAEMDENQEKWAIGLEMHLSRVERKVADINAIELRDFAAGIAQGAGESIVHFKSLEDFLGGWKERILEMMQQMAMRAISTWAMLQILGTDSEGNSGKDIKLGGALGTALGTAVGGPIGGILGGFLGKKLRFAEGGMMPAGVPSMIGDSLQAANGEWVIPRLPSMAIPSAMLDGIAGRAANYMNSRGGDTITHVNIQVAKIDSQIDIDRLGQDLAWYTNQRERVR